MSQEKPLGHYGLLVLPLSIITVLCFGFVLLQSPAKLTKMVPASVKHLPESQPEASGLAMAPLDQLPHLLTAPVPVPSGTGAATPTASPQDAVSGNNLIDLQDAASPKAGITSFDHTIKVKSNTSHHKSSSSRRRSDN